MSKREKNKKTKKKLTKFQVKTKLFRLLNSFGKKTATKMSNISGKTGQYNVPDDLFQRRTNRSNRVLISWRTVCENGFTMEQLETFDGGVVVEFINNDFFDEEYKSNPLFIELKKRLGGNQTVASILSFRSESTSSSRAAQDAFAKFISGMTIEYMGNLVVITEDNFRDYVIKKTGKGSKVNDNWEGFLFVSIKGGRQESIKSHQKGITMFNPACEYANNSVACDLNLVMGYFAYKSIDSSTLSEKYKNLYDELKTLLPETLREIRYDNDTYSGDLLTYCEKHPSVKMIKGKLCDPIQIEEIHIGDFDVDNKADDRNIDFTHDEAVNLDRYYWDKANNCILSPARPTNVFWSRHLSNMMQQNFSLAEYFLKEKERVEKRKRTLKGG